MRRLIAILFLIGNTFTPALGRDSGQWQYAAPDVHEYFATLKQPDFPGTSCCGEGDVYWADETDMGPDGELIAIVTDTRPDEALHRTHVAPGTRVIVPKNKLRPPPGVPNPTGHTILFLGVSWEGVPYAVYCYEPQPMN